MFSFWGSKRETAAEKATQELNREALSRAQHHWQMQVEVVAHQLISGESIDGVPIACVGEIAADHERLRYIKLRFMWGWFREYVNSTDWLAAEGVLRTNIHMIGYIYEIEGDFERARLTAIELDAEFNDADPLFDSISEIGRRSYSSPKEPHLAFALSTMCRVEAETE